jgi:hypothetical protein
MPRPPRGARGSPLDRAAHRLPDRAARGPPRPCGARGFPSTRRPLARAGLDHATRTGPSRPPKW